MPSKFARRQNTDGWWSIHLNRVIESGEELRERRRETFQALDDLKTYQDDIDRWLGGAASEIRGIYHDPSVAAEYCRPVSDIDLHGLSWADVIKSLKMTVDERIRGVRNLIDSTSP
jgi:hypothetical protein